MGKAEAVISGDRIVLRTYYPSNEFQYALSLCKSVPGGRFWNSPSTGDKYWHYPCTLETCQALRRAFGEDLAVGVDLADWYRSHAAYANAQAELSATTDAQLVRVPEALRTWLRGYQRAGAAWIARGYRNAGLVADTPGLGKTAETLAGIVEAGITGPVLIVCPKASVRNVWAKEISRHLPGVPYYACHGTRERRQSELDRFADDMETDPLELRFVIVVAEMLRVEMGDPCYSVKDGEPNNKISGMCKQKLRNNGFCFIHTTKIYSDEKERTKERVPVGFSFPILFTGHFDPQRSWAAVVLDESHKLLGSLTVVKGNLMGRGLKLLPCKPNHRRYALSGTPNGKGGRVEGLFGTLHWLWPDEYTSFWRWAASAFAIEEKIINRRGKTVKEIKGLKGLRPDASPEEESQALESFLATFGPRILRRTKEECLSELPPKQYVEVVCEMTTAQRDQHEQLADVAEIKTPGGVVMPNGSLAILMRMRQLANGVITKGPVGKVQFTGESGKLDQLWQNLEERGILAGQPGPKVIVASEFNEFLDVVAVGLRKQFVNFYQIDGRTSETRRDAQMHSWQSEDNTTRVMLLNTKAGGVSITLDAADEMHIMDEDTDPGVMEQLEDRIHRASRVHQVTIYYYRTEGTVDLKRAHDAEYRRKVQHAVLDGRRGASYVREFMKEALEVKASDPG